MQGLRTCPAASVYPQVTDSEQNVRLLLRAAAKVDATGVGDRAFANPVIALCLAPFLMGHLSAQSFSDSFNSRQLDTSKWTIATYQSPDSKPGINRGVYVPENIDLSQGVLRIAVTQKRSGDEVQSAGGALISKELFGFGTYEFEMRMSSTASTPQASGDPKTGAVSSGFLYLKNSETEIDLEFLGNENSIWITTWHNHDPKRPPHPSDKQSNKIANHFLGTQFRTYRLVWSSKTVNVFIDGVQVVHQTADVPQKPAHIILQHRGTNSDKWGGTATLGTPRYFYVKSVRFTPEEHR
jgi:beta-glucanase (GH16 family)